MKKALILTTALLLILVFSGLGLAIQMGNEGTGDESPLLTIGSEVWRHISEEEPYTQWDLWPGKGRMFEGTEPHGAFLTVYISEGARNAIEGKKGKFSQGAIIVKENYRPDKTLAAVTVMYKAVGYNPEAGDWFWAKFQPDGTVDAEGKVDGCIKCHRKASDNDWVFTGKIE